jgi:hypothetical protein
MTWLVQLNLKPLSNGGGNFLSFKKNHINFGNKFDWVQGEEDWNKLVATLDSNTLLDIIDFNSMRAWIHFWELSSQRKIGTFYNYDTQCTQFTI